MAVTGKQQREHGIEGKDVERMGSRNGHTELNSYDEFAHGQRSLVGCSLWGPIESDTTE